MLIAPWFAITGRLSTIENELTSLERERERERAERERVTYQFQIEQEALKKREVSIELWIVHITSPLCSGLNSLHRVIW